MRDDHATEAGGVQHYSHYPMNMANEFAMFPQFPENGNYQSYPGIRISEPGSSSTIPKVSEHAFLLIFLK